MLGYLFNMAKTYIKNRFGVVPNDLLNNKQISFKAKGIYAYIQSKPDGWDFSIERISWDCNEGQSSVRSGIQELEKAGYLLRKMYKNHKGHNQYDYYLYDKPTYENPTLENPSLENPTLENQRTNKERDKVKKNISKKEFLIIPFEENSLRFELFTKWLEYKKEKKQSYTKSGFESLIKKMDIYTDLELEAMMENSMANNWSGIFPFKKEINNQPTIGKWEQSMTNLDRASNRIKQQIKDGTFVNPFDTKNW